MAEKKQSRGTCMYCGAIMSRGGMPKHLRTCSQRQEAIEKAERGKGRSEIFYHLRVRDAYQDSFWLDLEIGASDTLGDLDYYLRKIWLECCGHLSQFSIGGWRGDEISMSRKISQVFHPGVEVTHIYDFGTSSETLIKLLGTREGKPTTGRPVALMARNLMPGARCRECEEPATRLCIECLCEHNDYGMLCDRHAKTHHHKDYGKPVKLVNSPRLGMCGYTGPAEPPY